MEDREIRNVLDVLDNAGIRYRMVSHDPVYTIEEMERLHLDADAEIAKNLFLRDARGKRHFLVVLCSCKTVDLKALRGQLGTSALSFASEDRLKRFLGLEKGAVTPLGILNDEARAVEVLFDRDLAGLPSLGVHPNRNTATVFLAFSDLESLIRSHGNSVSFVAIGTSDNVVFRLCQLLSWFRGCPFARFPLNPKKAPQWGWFLPARERFSFPGCSLSLSLSLSYMLEGRKEHGSLPPSTIPSSSDYYSADSSPS